MKRKGSFAQPFAILLFVFLCFVGFLLLGLEKNANSPVNQDMLEQDVLDQQAHAVLLSWLRTPYSVDLNGDFIPEDADISTLIAMTGEVNYLDKRLADAIGRNQIPGFYAVSIRYTFSDQEFREYLAGSVDISHLASSDVDDLERLPEGTRVIPGRIFNSYYDLEDPCIVETGFFQRQGNVVLANNAFFSEWNTFAFSQNYGRAQIVLPGTRGNILVQFAYVDTLEDAAYEDLYRKMRLVYAQSQNRLGGGTCAYAHLP